MDKEKEPTMSLKAQLSDAIKNAMRNKEKDKLTTLRMYSAAIKQREVDERKELEEDECLKVLTTMIKQRKEAFKQYEEAGRSDLAEKEVAEIKGIIREIEVFPSYKIEWWFVPIKSGEFNDLECNVKDKNNNISHKDMGMVGKIIIK